MATALLCDFLWGGICGCAVVCSDDADACCVTGADVGCPNILVSGSDWPLFGVELLSILYYDSTSGMLQIHDFAGFQIFSLILAANDFVVANYDGEIGDFAGAIELVT